MHAWQTYLSLREVWILFAWRFAAARLWNVGSRCYNTVYNDVLMDQTSYSWKWWRSLSPFARHKFSHLSTTVWQHELYLYNWLGALVPMPGIHASAMVLTDWQTDCSKANCNCIFGTVTYLHLYDRWKHVTIKDREDGQLRVLCHRPTLLSLKVVVGNNHDQWRKSVYSNLLMKVNKKVRMLRRRIQFNYWKKISIWILCHV